jgi:hypothetical protein
MIYDRSPSIVKTPKLPTFSGIPKAAITIPSCFSIHPSHGANKHVVYLAGDAINSFDNPNSHPQVIQTSSSQVVWQRGNDLSDLSSFEFSVPWKITSSSSDKVSKLFFMSVEINSMQLIHRNT